MSHKPFGTAAIQGCPLLVNYIMDSRVAWLRCASSRALTRVCSTAADHAFQDQAGALYIINCIARSFSLRYSEF